MMGIGTYGWWDRDGDNVSGKYSDYDIITV